MKKKLFFFLVIFLFSQNVTANTTSNCEDKFNQNISNNLYEKKIESIEVTFQNYRNWIKNGIRILISEMRITPEKFKRRFAGDIIIKYEGDLKCKLPARIRHSGDFKDHILVKKNSFIQSLDIHLKAGNIKGITKFKLFIIEAKDNYEDEVFMPVLLQEFKYLSPRTHLIKAKINNVETNVLFQEKASKELLEFNQRRDGPIFEGQENYMFNKNTQSVLRDQKSHDASGFYNAMKTGVKGQLSKQINTNWNNKGEKFSFISHQAISNLNLTYLNYIEGYQDKKNNVNFNTYNLNNKLLAFYNPENILKLEIYNLLIFSSNGSHGLAPYNRKFYWNSMENYFEPINYDSQFNIDDPNIYFYLPFNNETLEAFKKLDILLSRVDIKKLQKKINQNGLNYSENKVKNKINKIRLNLKTIKYKYETFDPELLDYNLNFNNNEQMWKNYVFSLKKMNEKIFVVYKQKSKQKKNNQINLNENKFYKCDVENLNCSQIKLSNKQQNILIEGNLNFAGEYYQYIGKNFETDITSSISKFEKVTISNSNFYFDKNINFNFDKKNKILDIYQLKFGARAFFYEGIVEDIYINFHGYNENSNYDFINYPIDENNLTGCLSFINLKIRKILINTKGSSCEDAINLINVNGSINEINIENSFSDGLDVDFSRVEINSIKIDSAHNDCVDFSAGNYKINILKLKNCGDKALSVGEKSFLTLNTIFAENANIGIASKDDSEVKIIDANLKNLKICVAAYNKKQEFGGGFIYMKYMNCEKYYVEADLDVYSKIIKNEKSLKNYNYGTIHNSEKTKIAKVNNKQIKKNLIKDYETLNQDGTVNAVIEIPVGLKEKWEVSKISGSLSREFYMGQPRTIKYKAYPTNYGMIPKTVLPTKVGGDGDPLDILILGDPLIQGDVVKVKIIGMIKMKDFGEQDDKIIAVQTEGVFSNFDNLAQLKREYPEVIEKIKVWFTNYKGKNIVNFIDYGTKEEAQNLIFLSKKYYKRFGIKPRS